MKRIFDILVSLISLILLAPLLLLIAVLVAINLGRPIFFLQQRPGLNDKLFTIIKFRTMRDAIDELPDEERLTNFGKILRASSLDELPELWNVLKGDMALVGPRPLLVEYLSLYDAEQRRRHEVRPGITGWAQINGRNAISWKDKFRLDVWYVDNQTTWLDMKILLVTLKKVFIKEGISASNHATVERFTGNE